jgi:25S rRNA (cytosine2278-C5)-methyltransferase
VNTILSSVDQVLERLLAEGYELCAPDRVRASRKPQGRRSTPERLVALDEHVANVILLPAGTDLHAHPLLLCGAIVLQDKASCFSAAVLNPPPDAQVIDACAAPGNKTSHAAALMRNRGTVYAFDRDARRLDLLRRLTSRAGATCISPRCADFLAIDPNTKEFSQVCMCVCFFLYMCLFVHVCVRA